MRSHELSGLFASVSVLEIPAIDAGVDPCQRPKAIKNAPDARRRAIAAA